MGHWSRLAIRNWRVRWRRTAGALAAVALGVAAIVWVTCCYESVRQTILRWADDYVGDADITVSSPLGKYDQIPQRLTRLLKDVDGVELVAPRLLQRVFADPWASDQPAVPGAPSPFTPEVDLHGVDLTTEFAVREYQVSAGRMLGEEDDLACVLEADFARSRGIGVGDWLLVWQERDEPATRVEIIGLFEQRRIARFQKPVALMRLAALQRMTSKFALITDAAIQLDERSEAGIKRASGRVHSQVRRVTPNARVRSTEARIKQVEYAQRNQQVLLTLLSYVAMLTALFIIVSTLSMGLVERVRELGLMRCIGLTRLQMAALVLIETLPLGVLGVLFGVPLGLGFTALTVYLAPEYVGRFVISSSGVLLAAVSGLLTTGLAALIPMIGAVRVAPLEAAHPQSRRAPAALLVAATAAAAAVFAVQHFGVLTSAQRSLVFVYYAIAAVVLLYLAYALLAPLLVRAVGAPAVWLTAAVLRVRTKLLQDQVGHAVWRSAGICCGIMVGLSLIVAVVVVNQTITSGWQFPKHFPEAYLWSFDQLPAHTAQALEGVPGIREFTVANSINVIVEERPAFGEELLMSVTWFMGVEPDSFLKLVQLDFVEGEREQALAQLSAGGHVLIADDFARSRNKHVGDGVKVFVGSRSEVFTVAGVIRSPAIDIAAGYFQLQAEYSVVASGSVIGTNRDLRERFKIHGIKLALLNFDLPAEEPPLDWPPARDSVEGARLPGLYYEESRPRAERWQRWREEQVLRTVQARMEAPRAFTGTIRELKDTIDAELTAMTRLFTAIPAVALLVAAVGVANLMTANVTARARQFAILRAIGATRGLVLRLVFGEAIVLGLLGSALGLALGVHLAWNLLQLTRQMWGFDLGLRLPFEYIGLSVALTVALCLIAGALPARRAARTDVVAALHVA